MVDFFGRGNLFGTGSNGGTGAPGPSGPAGPAGAGLTIRDAWDNATAYAARDVVSHDGDTWIAKVANTNVEPTDANSATWLRGTHIAEWFPSGGTQGQAVERGAGAAFSSTFLQFGSVQQAEPSIRSFQISIASHILATSQVGSHEATFFLTNEDTVASIVLRATPAGGSAVDLQTYTSVLVEHENTVSFSITGPQWAALTSGDPERIDFQLVGTDTNGGSFSSNIVPVSRRDPPVAERLYFGTSDTNVAASISTSSLQFKAGTSGKFTPNTWTGRRYVLALYPDSDPAVTQFLVGGSDQLDAFDVTPSAFDIAGTDYTMIISKRTQSAPPVELEIIR